MTTSRQAPEETRGYQPLSRGGVGTVVGILLALVVALIFNATGGPGGSPPPQDLPAPSTSAGTGGGSPESTDSVRAPDSSSRQPARVTGGP